MKLSPEIEQLLKDRYYLENEISWISACDRWAKIYPGIKQLLLERKFLFSTPTLMNAYTEGKRKGTLSSCFPLEIGDSIEDIFKAITEAAIVTKMSGGVGHNYSTLRSSQEVIQSLSGSDGYRKSSGPIGFMRIMSTMLDCVSQGGARKGAGMGELSIYHPDIWDFICSKKDHNNKSLDKMNISCRIPDDFYRILKETPEKPFSVQYVTNKEWHPLFIPQITKDKKIEKIQATYGDVWKWLIHNAWLTADPGILNSDTAFKRCTVTHLDTNVHSNPCAEFINISNSSCNLGSFNLAKYVKNGKFDWESYSNDIDIATIALDKVLDINEYPLESIKKTTLKIRPIGLGIMGFAHTLMKMHLPYNSEEAFNFAEEIAKYTTLRAMQQSCKLAKEEGKYPAYNEQLFFKANERFWVSDCRDIKIKDLQENIKKYGVRNSCFTSIAPTGTISYICDTTSGIEPVYGLVHSRNIVANDGTKRTVQIEDPVFRTFIKNNYPDKAEEIFSFVNNNQGSCKKCTMISEDHRKLFLTANDLVVSEHIEILSRFANNVSLSVSKTINLPHDCTEKDISDAYLLAHEKGIIGVTVYRDGCKSEQVLSTHPTPFTGIPSTQAPKRPKDLKAEVHHFTIKRQKYYVVVGLYGLNGQPYEVFTGLNYDEKGDVYIPIIIKTGNIRKIKRGSYSLIVEDKDGEISFPLLDSHVEDSAAALTLQISLNLRHGTDIKWIVSALEKSTGSLISFSRALARSLKKYIPDGALLSGENCPSCGSSRLARYDGCKTCLECRYSFCS